MKRSSKIIMVVFLILNISIWASNYYDLYDILLPYLIGIFLFALHAAYKILTSVFSLQNNPKERENIN